MGTNVKLLMLQYRADLLEKRGMHNIRLVNKLKREIRLQLNK